MNIQGINIEIFVIHALVGYEEQEKRLIKLFEENKLKFEWETKGDPKHITPSVLEKYFSNDIKEKLSLGVLSCTLNHFYAYEKIVERNIPYAIIFENDPFFIGNFKFKLNKILSELCTLEKGFIVSIENTSLEFPSFWQTKSNKYLYKAKAGRMAGGYIIDATAAKNILAFFNTQKCDRVIDHWHNYLIEKNIFQMYWAHPPLMEQGSHNGLLNAGISTKAKNKTRRTHWLLQKFYKMYVGRFFRQKKIL